MMNETINEILAAYNRQEATLEATNQALELAGANFKLVPQDATGWTEAEMVEGFLPCTPAKEAQKELDKTVRPELAGQVTIQTISGSNYFVIYNDKGQVEKALKAKH